MKKSKKEIKIFIPEIQEIWGGEQAEGRGARLHQIPQQIKPL